MGNFKMSCKAETNWIWAELTNSFGLVAGRWENLEESMDEKHVYQKNLDKETIAFDR